MRIRRKDTVYILCDFAFDDVAAAIAESLNGKKRLILGNHDRTLTKRVLRQFDFVATIRTIDDCCRSVCLRHYPLLSYVIRSMEGIKCSGISTKTRTISLFLTAQTFEKF